jgi:hypothetical protein
LKPLPLGDRREHARHLCSDFVQLAWRDRHDRAISHLVVLEDIGVDGMCVHSELPAPLGQSVNLHRKDWSVRAWVRYCKLSGCGYLIGLEFRDGYTWDRKEWRPQHLLAL